VRYIAQPMGGRAIQDNANAFTFTFAGHIAVRLHASDTHIELAVADTGTGIPSEELSKVFERFHRSRARAVGASRGPASVSRSCRSS